MRPYNVSLIVLGVTAMLAINAANGNAQVKDTTRMRDTTGRNVRQGRQMRAGMTSQERIRISKSATAGGEVAAMRVDTVTVIHTDTVTVSHTDTVTRTRTDTVTVQLPAPPRLVHYPDGVYFGVGGGVNQPAGSMYTPNAAGLLGQAQLGWQSFTMPIGLRLDANYSKLGEDSYYSAFANNAQIWNVNGDLKLGLPILNHVFGISPRFGVYGIGGASYSRWRDVFIASQPGVAGGVGPVNATYSHDWQDKMGWNAGGGASLMFNRTEIFAEARLISFSPENAKSNARQVPVVLGVNWYGGTITR